METENLKLKAELDAVKKQLEEMRKRNEDLSDENKVLKKRVEMLESEPINMLDEIQIDHVAAVSQNEDNLSNEERRDVKNFTMFQANGAFDLDALMGMGEADDDLKNMSWSFTEDNKMLIKKEPLDPHEKLAIKTEMMDDFFASDNI